MGSGRRAALLGLLGLAGLAALVFTWDDLPIGRVGGDDPTGAATTAESQRDTATARGLPASVSATRGRKEKADARAAAEAERRKAAEQERGAGTFFDDEEDDSTQSRILYEFPDVMLLVKPVEVWLDVDPVTAEAPEAPGGIPPEMDITHFAERGVRAVETAVELVGERTPVLEEGVPVSLTGHVLSKETGEPIEGATVLVTSTFYVRNIQYDHHLREVARVETDDEGAFHVERLNADPAHFGEGGKVYVTVTADGHAPALARPLARVTSGFRNRLPDIALVKETHALRGRVLCHWNDDPIVGARVIATGAIDPVAYPKDQRDALFVGAPETVTDAEGRFELAGLGAGVQTVSLHGGDDCVGVDAVRVPRKDEVVIRAFPLRGRIEGRVVDAAGEPIALVLVRGGWNSTHSFADGSFVLENFRGDVVDLAFSHAQYSSHTEKGVVDGRKDLEIHLASRWPRVQLSVRRHDDDEPVRKVAITLETGGEQPLTLPASPTYLSAAGVHALRVPAGVAKATVRADGLRPRELDLAAVQEGDRLDVVLMPEQAPDAGR